VFKQREQLMKIEEKEQTKKLMNENLD